MAKVLGRYLCRCDFEKCDVVRQLIWNDAEIARWYRQNINYNYGRYLGVAIDSALAQTYGRMEVVVVDDGSTDDSREAITRFTERVVSVLKINGGQPSAYNSGFAASSGDIICFLDADD